MDEKDKELQDKLNCYLKKNKLNPSQINVGNQENPFPIGGRYIQEIANGDPGKVGKPSKSHLNHFLKEKCKNKK